MLSSQLDIYIFIQYIYIIITLKYTIYYYLLMFYLTKQCKTCFLTMRTKAPFFSERKERIFGAHVSRMTQ